MMLRTISGGFLSGSCFAIAHKHGNAGLRDEPPKWPDHRDTEAQPHANAW